MNSFKQFQSTNLAMNHLASACSMCGKMMEHVKGVPNESHGDKFDKQKR